MITGPFTVLVVPTNDLDPIRDITIAPASHLEYIRAVARLPGTAQVADWALSKKDKAKVARQLRTLADRVER